MSENSLRLKKITIYFWFRHLFPLINFCRSFASESRFTFFVFNLSSFFSTEIHKFRRLEIETKLKWSRDKINRIALSKIHRFAIFIFYKFLTFYHHNY